jgi:hypothetical protein
VKTNIFKILGRTSLAVLAALALAEFPPGVCGQGGVPLWTNSYTEPSNPLNGIAVATAMAVDESGNVFVTGNSPTLVYGGSDIATIKYSSSGVPLWTNRYSAVTNGYNYPGKIAVNRDGNVFVTGSLSDTYPNSTIAYSNGGLPLWTNQYDGRAASVAVDSSGHVFVTGAANGRDSLDYGTVAYSSAGVPLWTNKYDGPGHSIDSACALTVDCQGNVIVTGWSARIDNLHFDYTTIEYSGSGLPLWTNSYDGSGNSNFLHAAVAADASGNVFVTAYSDASNSWHDYATVAYSSAGIPLWTNRCNGATNGDAYARAVAVDGKGDVFVTGTFGTVSSSGAWLSSVFATVAYSNGGVPLWTNLYSWANDDHAMALAVDGSGNVFVTGHSFDNDTFYDYATVAYSADGAEIWSSRYNNPDWFNHDYPTAIAVDRYGNVFVTGFSYSDGYVTIKYSSSLGPHLTIERDGSGGLFVRYTGAPDVGYCLQRADSVSGPWSDIATNTAPASGIVEYHETIPPASQAFYRVRTQ